MVSIPVGWKGSGLSCMKNRLSWRILHNYIENVKMENLQNLRGIGLEKNSNLATKTLQAFKLFEGLTSRVGAATDDSKVVSQSDFTMESCHTKYCSRALFSS